MARAIPTNYEMYLIVRFSTNIRGHHVYKEVWTPEIGESLFCKHDERLEAKELDENAVGTYKKRIDEKLLVGHLPIELSKLINFFIDIENNHVHAVVTGKRIREVGLSVPAKFHCFTSSKRQANVLHDELLQQKPKYSFLSLVVEEFVERKRPKFL